MKKSSLPLIHHIQNFLDYCDIVRGNSAQTLINYKHFLTTLRNWMQEKKLDDLKPHELVNEHIYQYRLYLSQKTNLQTQKNLKKTTQNYYLIALRLLLMYFADKDILSLPSDKISLPKLKNIRRPKFLTIDQMEKLLLSPTPNTILGLRDRAILESLFSTGMRVGELVSLNIEQIPKKILYTNRTAVLELPITGKGGYMRTVYFSRRALDSLTSYLEKRNDDEKALFIHFSNKNKKRKGKRLTIRSIERIIKKYVKIAGLPIDTTPHTLRHSYATDLLANGVDLRVIQEFLGHQNIATTQVYTHITNKQLREIHKKFHSGKRLKKAYAPNHF